MITVTRRFEFDYGHRVLNHESKCKNLHGHRGVLEVTISGARLDGLGRVIDFGELKQILGDWIDREWDHNMILHPDDPLLGLITDKSIFPDKLPFVMPGSMNPTAENMAIVFLTTSIALMGKHNINLNVDKVRLFETPNCFAEFSK